MARSCRSGPSRTLGSQKSRGRAVVFGVFCFHRLGSTEGSLLKGGRFWGGGWTESTCRVRFAPQSRKHVWGSQNFPEPGPEIPSLLRKTDFWGDGDGDGVSGTRGNLGTDCSEVRGRHCRHEVSQCCEAFAGQLACLPLPLGRAILLPGSRASIADACRRLVSRPDGPDGQRPADSASERSERHSTDPRAPPSLQMRRLRLR